MNYIGSKHTLAEFVSGIILQRAGSLQARTFAELFGGTGAVARRLKTHVARLLANDVEYYGFVLLRNYLGNNRPLVCAPWLQRLNALPPVEGFIFRHYCAGGGSGRQYFSDANGRRIDAVRLEIERGYSAREMDADLYFFLLASLLESADRTANTASVYEAYLKHLKRTAQKPLVIEPAHFSPSAAAVEVYQEDINQLIPRLEGDVLYLDPPYNHRQYGSCYHMLNTIARYAPFEPRGKTGLPDYYKSRYCRRGQAARALEEVVKAARFRYIFISYNDEGIIPLPVLQEMLRQYGRYDLASRPYTRYKADRDENRTYKKTGTTEYLHILEKTRWPVQRSRVFVGGR